MPPVTLDVVTQKAVNLGFKVSMVAAGRYRMLHPGTSYGYQGNLDGCLSYLHGWEECQKFHSHRW